MPKVIILGTGGHAQVLWAAWQKCHTNDPTTVFSLAGWLEAADYKGSDTFLNLPVFQESRLGWDALRKQGVTHFYPGIGMVRTNPERWVLIQRLIAEGLQPATLIHPTAIIDPSADIAEGCYIGARTVIQPFAKICAGAIINTGAIVEHHTKVGLNVHVAPGAILCGQVSVGDHSMIGAGAVVIQRITVGHQVTVGAASVVVHDLPHHSVAIGNPARFEHRNKQDKY